ncbi:MAG: tetratricopeptide repeat protein [Ferruginibacter sp.]
MKNTFVFVLLLLCLSRATAQTFGDAVQASHEGKYYKAEAGFKALLSKDKNNIEVLLASGFNYAWNREYGSAKERFQQVLKLKPGHADAVKGMAYVYLYSESYTKAAAAFQNLVNANPSSQEYRMALALAYMNLQKKGKAMDQFRKILELNPGNEEAKKYISNIMSGRSVAELMALAGNTLVEGQSKFGLRQVQLGFYINSENMVYLRYDNALSLDNYFLLQSNEKTRGYFGGFYSRWQQRIGSKFEYGSRSLPDNKAQNIFQTEQLVFLPKNYVVKLGGSYVSTTGQPGEWMMMAGVSAPVGSRIRIEPNYYFIQRAAKEQRLLLSAKYNFNAYTDAGLGVYTGREREAKKNIDNKIYGIYAYGNFPIAGPLYGTANARYEKDATGQHVFIAAAGIKISFSKNGFKIQN